MHATAEADEVIAALQVALPTATTRIILKEHLVCQSGRELTVITVKNLRMPQNRLICRLTCGRFHAWRRWYEGAGIGPTWRRSSRRSRRTRELFGACLL